MFSTFIIVVMLHTFILLHSGSWWSQNFNWFFLWHHFCWNNFPLCDTCHSLGNIIMTELSLFTYWTNLKKRAQKTGSSTQQCCWERAPLLNATHESKAHSVPNAELVERRRADVDVNALFEPKLDSLRRLLAVFAWLELHEKWQIVIFNDNKIAHCAMFFC